MIFEKPSLRTRVTFEVGMQSMGGAAVFSRSDGYAAWRTRIDSRRGAQPRALGAGHRRARVFTERAGRTGGACEHPGDQRAFRSLSSVPGALRISSRSRNISATARGLKLAYVGDGNNVCHSLMVAGARVGAHVRVGDAQRVTSRKRKSSRSAARRGATQAQHRTVSFRRRSRCRRASRLHRCLDQHGPGRGSRSAREIFAPYQVNAALMKQAASGRRVSSLPARASRLRSHRRSDGFAALHRVRPGGKPPARAESHPADACSAERNFTGAEESSARLFRRT